MTRLVSCALLVAVVLSCVFSGSNAQPFSQTDINTLQYALTLENLESAFYNMAIANYSSYLNSTLFPYNFAAYIGIIAAHEQSHVTALSQAITASGSTAVRPCSYNFASAFTSPQAFVATAAALEATGQAAYDGAINTLNSTVLQTTAATIATIEARHASYLAIVSSALGGPFPNPIDNAYNSSQIATMALPFFVNCPYNLTQYLSLPAVRPGGVAIVNGAVVQTGGGGGTYTQAQQNNDIIALNYALTLENFEAALYVYGNRTFSYAQFAAAGFSNLFYTYFQSAASQEVFHAQQLTLAVNGRVANAAVPPCTYNFNSITGVTQFLNILYAVESTGTSAYDGAVNTIVDTNLQQTAASIATVEARHTAFLGNYTAPNYNYMPFTPTSFDNATLPAAVVAAVASLGFITSCPYNIQAPTFLPVVGAQTAVAIQTFPATGASATPTSTGVASSTAVSGSTGGLSPAVQGDYNTLQFALTLENLEAAFYAKAVQTFNQTYFSAQGYPSTFYQYIQVIASQEAQHVSLLTSVINTITAPNNTAVPACTYTWLNAFSSVQAFVNLAATFENTGVQAYDGAINSISNPTYQQVAATIATVEGRHAAFLNQLIAPLFSTSPFPNTVDPTKSGSDVASAIAPYISCPYNINLYFPQIRPGGVALSSNGQVVQTSNTPNGVYTAAQQQNDLVALNYALTLENFEAAFYAYANATFNATSYAAAGYPSYVQGFVTMIASQEALHAFTLSSAVNARYSYAAVPSCVYNFNSITSVVQFLTTAAAIENVGVQAYDGAVNTIVDTNLQQTAATIATVEARHSSFLYNITGTSPFNNTFDNTLTPQQVLALVQSLGYITSCPYTFQYPVVGAVSAVSIPTFQVSSTGVNIFPSYGSTGSSAYYPFIPSSSGNAAPSFLLSPAQLLATVLALAFAVVALLA